MADSKVPDLTAIGALASGDLVYVVDDPGGTPLDRKATVDQVKEFCYPRGFVYGGKLSNAAGDATNDITIQPLVVQDEGGGGLLELTAARTKQIDAAWAVGDNAGGMNTGSVANDTWYEVIAVKRTDTGVVDVMFSTTANRATLPTNYTLKARIGWVRRGTAANLVFTQRGDFFTLTTPINDVAASKATSQAAVTLTVPPNAIALFRAGADMSTSVNANSALVFREIGEADTAPALATGNISLGYWDLATGASGGHFAVRADGSSQIRHDADTAVGAFDISTYGWVDDYRGLAAP